MDTDAFKANLASVKELILDEQKLVTYISLSKELCIHVNEAKSLLSQIIQDIRKAQPEMELCVSYVISGLLRNNSGCTTVCSETDLGTVKKTLKIIFYDHVYCVSVGHKSVDKVALTSINQFGDYALCTGLIAANSCTKRTAGEIGNLKSNINHAVVIAPKSVQQKLKGATKIDHGENMQTSKNTDVILEPSIKSETPSINVLPKKSPIKVHSNKKTTKGIAGFFSKATGDSSKTKKSIISLESKVKVKEEKVEEASIETPKPTKNAPIINGKEKVSSDSLTKIKKNAKVDKKRKRLLHVSDSESESEELSPFANEMVVDHDSEDEIPPTPTVNTVKITLGIVNPKKRRKIVDKTYTDEDGYILTKKEEVYESCSDNDEESKENAKLDKNNTTLEKGKFVQENIKQSEDNSIQVKQFKMETSPKEKKSKKKVSPPQKGKQSTINNFFKKV